MLSNLFNKLDIKKTKDNTVDIKINVSIETKFIKDMLLANFERYFNYPEINYFPIEKRKEIVEFFLSNANLVKSHLIYIKKLYGEQWYKNEEAKDIIDKLESISVFEKRRMTSLQNFINSKRMGVIKGKWKYNDGLSPKWKCKYKEHENKNNEIFLLPDNIEGCENLPGFMPGCSCIYTHVLDKEWLNKRSIIFDNTNKYKDEILNCLYEISKNNDISEPYKALMNLSNEIPDFECLLENLRVDGLILYQHFFNGLEYNLDNPLTPKGIEYCKR